MAGSNRWPRKGEPSASHPFFSISWTFYKQKRERLKEITRHRMLSPRTDYLQAERHPAFSGPLARGLQALQQSVPKAGTY